MVPTPPPPHFVIYFISFGLELRIDHIHYITNELYP